MKWKLYRESNESDFKIRGVLEKYLGSGGDVVIPDGVTEIAEGAFNLLGATRMTSVEIPMGVTRIREWAFYNCSNLSSVSIPDSVKRIDDYAFFNTKLTRVRIPHNVKLGEHAFPKGCEVYD